MPKTDAPAAAPTKMVATPATMPHPTQPAPTVYPSNIPKAQNPSGLPDASVAGAFPPDSEFKGSYKKDDDGLTYALAVVDDDPLGRTHKAKNTLRTWEGTSAEFRAQFQVSDSDKRVPKDDAGDAGKK